MNKQDLQLTAARFMVDSKMSKSAKLQMLQFIKNEATEEQLMVILMDGKIERLDEQGAQVAKDRFYASKASDKAKTKK